MAIGLPAKYRKRINHPFTEKIIRKFDNPLFIHPFKLVKKIENRITLRAKWSVWSWGEIITVDFSDKDTISIASRCSVPFQLFDWGKNRENVDRLVMRIYNS
ncbi:MAG: hypothetical protein JJU46_13650 [Balneolaceae bacterium]|nr:hypothetical protein [Balneolaceae bacterium]MCH8550069.1 hypothetical protein [Balneolaceae bacterium]